MAERTSDTDEQRLERALALAYRHLNRRERTETELGRHLDAHDVPAPVAEQAIASLRDQGYVDDVRYARLFAEDKRALEEWGSERIRRALLERGIDRDIVESTVAQAPSEDELERAQALLRRRFPSPLGDRRERERALGVLLRKGFDSDLALEALAGHRADGLA